MVFKSINVNGVRRSTQELAILCNNVYFLQLSVRLRLIARQISAVLMKAEL